MTVIRWTPVLCNAVKFRISNHPSPLAEAAEVIPVHAGQGFRLQIINGAVSRFFRLLLTDQNGEQITMFRVGGEGGLLDRVRIEGGIHGKLNSKFPRGELMLANADRADVVACPPCRSRTSKLLTTITQPDFSKSPKAIRCEYIHRLTRPSIA
jgi:hypothetical protein